MFCDALNNLSVEIKGDRDLQIAALSIIKNVYQHTGIVKALQNIWDMKSTTAVTLTVIMLKAMQGQMKYYVMLDS